MTKTEAIRSRAALASLLAPVLLLATLGMGLVFFAGLANADALHDAAHDMRHASGFPCH